MKATAKDELAGRRSDFSDTPGILLKREAFSQAVPKAVLHARDGFG